MSSKSVTHQSKGDHPKQLHDMERSPLGLQYLSSSWSLVHEQQCLPSLHISTSTVWFISPSPSAAQRIPACSVSDFNYQKRQSLPLCSPRFLSQPPSSSSTWLLLLSLCHTFPSLIFDFRLSQTVSLGLSCFIMLSFSPSDVLWLLSNVCFLSIQGSFLQK